MAPKTESFPRPGFECECRGKDCFIHVGNRTNFLVERLLRVGYSPERSPECDNFSIFEVLQQAYKLREGGRGTRLERPADGRQKQADETQTTTATPSVPCHTRPAYAIISRGETVTMRRAINSKKDEGIPEALITPAERLR